MCFLGSYPLCYNFPCTVSASSWSFLEKLQGKFSKLYARAKLGKTIILLMLKKPLVPFSLSCSSSSSIWRRTWKPQMQRALLCKRAWTYAESLKSFKFTICTLCKDLPVFTTGTKLLCALGILLGCLLVTFSLLQLADLGPGPRDVFVSCQKFPFQDQIISGNTFM